MLPFSVFRNSTSVFPQIFRSARSLGRANDYFFFLFFYFRRSRIDGTRARATRYHILLSFNLPGSEAFCFAAAYYRGTRYRQRYLLASVSLFPFSTSPM